MINSTGSFHHRLQASFWLFPVSSALFKSAWAPMHSSWVRQSTPHFPRQGSCGTPENPVPACRHSAGFGGPRFYLPWPVWSCNLKLISGHSNCCCLGALLRFSYSPRGRYFKSVMNFLTSFVSAAASTPPPTASSSRLYSANYSVDCLSSR